MQAHLGRLLESGHGRHSARGCVQSADVYAAQWDRGHVTHGQKDLVWPVWILPDWSRKMDTKSGLRLSEKNSLDVFFFFLSNKSPHVLETTAIKTNLVTI